jgi:hypothetical protein
MKLRVDEIFAFVSEDADGDEGICAFVGEGGMWMPMVCADMARVDSLRPMAKAIRQKTGMKIKLVRFSKRSFDGGRRNTVGVFDVRRGDPARTGHAGDR